MRNKEIIQTEAMHLRTENYTIILEYDLRQYYKKQQHRDSYIKYSEINFNVKK